MSANVSTCTECSLPLDFAPANGERHLDCWPAFQVQLARCEEAIQREEARSANLNAALDRCEAADKSVDDAFATVFGRTP